MYKNAPSYIKEAHLTSLLTTVRADKLDKLLERLLGVVADGVVGEVRARLLDDWRRREMKTWRRGVRTRCKETNRSARSENNREEGWRRGTPWRKDVVEDLCLVGLLMHIGMETQRRVFLWAYWFKITTCAHAHAHTHAHKGMQMNFSEDGRRFDLIEIKMRLWWIEI